MSIPSPMVSNTKESHMAKDDRLIVGFWRRLLGGLSLSASLNLRIEVSANSGSADSRREA
jgi:hypothetical protein